MPRHIAPISARRAETIKEPGLHAAGDGLYLRITATGARGWVFRFQLAGRRRDMGLGPTSTVTLADARSEVQRLRKLVQKGIDPLDAKKAQAAEESLAAAKSLTFKDCAQALIKSKQAGWTNGKHRDQWTATLESYAYPVLGDLPISRIDTGLVLQVLEPIWTTKTETASRVRGRIEAVFDYAKVRGYRDGENPARWKGHLALILPAKGAVAKVEHHASLPYADLPAFFLRLQVQDGMGARALELCILTATRTSEVLGARWQEVDLDSRIWVIPADRMKAGHEHRVPLSEPAVTLLQKMASIRSSDVVFPGHRRDRPLSNMAMAMTLRRMGMEATSHGFRSTFRTWGAEVTRHPEHVLEAALAHTIADDVVAAYQRGDLFDKRRHVMETWGDYCTSVFRQE